ncbi:MAG: tetraacyldisaccharide 4'-kinase [Phocaeicola sp.]|uniref:tetraacyldisaccharide 4'-kinase n=1 Tax=Phocaeicola sp. TaxID=2773926 RepID=UPI0023BF9205|nr:tetraacyldisaccharide 4'-kinase [Phocaeicola sp.]MDE5678322.1 tetraacyldisaccharide 4'-kinase [Phocaeicola sp.]MDE6179781.1 tetraacyldisaccharide 4'-kinase [Phocaeicola sp.]
MKSSPIKIYKWLYPVSWLYGTGVWLRNKLFDWGIYKERRFDIPIISVGNITVGGTGKTPHTEYLIRLLQKDYQVAVLSRGYKRKSKGFILALPDTPVQIIGDEPFQMKQKFPNIYMAVDCDRCHGIEQLCHNHPTAVTEVIILDDAFQHRYVKPGMNILLVDYHRLICRDALLPAGRMREPESSKSRADIVIVTKCPKGITRAEMETVKSQMKLLPNQRLYFSTLIYGKLHPLFMDIHTPTPAKIEQNQHILLVTGIASPNRIIEELSLYNKHVNPLIFSDHHNFTAKDIDCIKKHFNRLPKGERIIITTEKDATKLVTHPLLDNTLKPYIYVLPIEISFLQDQQESFNSNITDYVRKNSRNSCIS